MKFLLVAAAYGFIFVAVELIAKKLHPPSEITRKLSHILAGIGAAMLPFVISFQEITLLGLLFVPAVYISMRSNMFTSIHNVRRNTYGELYFPLAIAICALLFPDKFLFIYAVLVIGVADALASLVGQRYSRKKRSFKKSQKSAAGSLAFFAATVCIGALLIVVFTGSSPFSAIFWSIALAIPLTFIEAFAKNGLDNLYVPVAACGLLGFVSSMGLLGN